MSMEKPENQKPKLEIVHFNKTRKILEDSMSGRSEEDKMKIESLIAILKDLEQKSNEANTEEEKENIRQEFSQLEGVLRQLLLS